MFSDLSWFQGTPLGNCCSLQPIETTSCFFIACIFKATSWNKLFLLCSQTCLYDHLYKTTTRLRRSMLSPPMQISIQLLLYKTTTCLTHPATFFVPQTKKNLCKTTTVKLYQTKKWEANVSPVILTLLLPYNAKFV